MPQPASGFLEMLGSVAAQALSPFKVRAPPTPLRCPARGQLLARLRANPATSTRSDRPPEVSPGMPQPASGFLEMLGSVAQALSPFKVHAPPTPLRCLARGLLLARLSTNPATSRRKKRMKRRRRSHRKRAQRRGGESTAAGARLLGWHHGEQVDLLVREMPSRSDPRSYGCS